MGIIPDIKLIDIKIAKARFSLYCTRATEKGKEGGGGVIDADRMLASAAVLQIRVQVLA